MDWNGWCNDYARVRAEMETWPGMFEDFETRMWTPGAVERPLPARNRKWQRPSGKAEFMVADGPAEDPDRPEPDPTCCAS